MTRSLPDIMEILVKAKPGSAIPISKEENYMLQHSRSAELHSEPVKNNISHIMTRMDAIQTEIAVVQSGMKEILDLLKQNTLHVNKHSPKPRKKTYTEADLATAKFIYDTISTNVPIKEPNYGRWANTVRLMREQDKRSDYDIRKAICAFAEDGFWSTTCLSAENLRRNFDRAAAIKVRDRDTGESLDEYRRKT